MQNIFSTLIISSGLFIRVYVGVGEVCPEDNSVQIVCCDLGVQKMSKWAATSKILTASKAAPHLFKP
jgi:hypothetical protein